MKTKILTRKLVEKLRFNKMSVITADMLDEYTSIESFAFSGCNSLTSVTIPNSVTNIGRGAFYGCHSLTSVIIPTSVTNIGDNVFEYCSSLTSVTIPNSIINIGYGTFENCNNLTSIKIPSSVTYIGPCAFAGCSGLISVIIPNSVTKIGVSAFEGCSSLTSVTIGNGVTSIGRSAFCSCNSLTSVSVEAGNTKYDSRDNCNAIIETSTNTLIVGCQNTTIPNSVTSIGGEAFYGCSGLTSVIIGNNITCIGRCAFQYCKFDSTERIDEYGRVIAYKGFNADMTCRNFQYKEGETYEIEDGLILCERGFHACLNPLDCFAYYYGQIGKDIVFHEVYLEGVSAEKHNDSKVVAKKITVGREISLSEMADIASGRK